MVVQLLVIVGSDVAAREDVFEVLRKIGVNGHQILEAAVLGALFDHPDFAIFLNDGGFDLADLFIEQNFVRQLAVENLLTDFGHALWAERVGCARPSERRLRLLVGLKQRLVRPLGRRRRIRLDAVHAIKNRPNALGSNRDCLLYIFNWLVHVLRTLSTAGMDFVAGASVVRKTLAISQGFTRRATDELRRSSTAPSY